MAEVKTARLLLVVSGTRERQQVSSGPKSARFRLDFVSELIRDFIRLFQRII